MYYFWDNWDLYHKVTFDGEARTITVWDSVTALDIKIDVYSDWKEWIQTYDNSKFLPAIRTIGGDPLGEQIYAGDIYFLINGWRLVVDLTKVKITGALYSDDYDTAYYAVDPLLNTLVPQYPAVVSQLVQTVVTTNTVPIVEGNPQTIAAQVWNELLTNYNLAGTFGQFVQNIPATTAALIPAAPSASTIANAVWDEAAMDHTTPGSMGMTINEIKADTGATSISNAALVTLVNTLLKYERNRTKIDTVNKQMIIYDDDCTTVLHVFDLKDSNGNPSVAEVCERKPVACP